MYGTDFLADDRPVCLIWNCVLVSNKLIALQKYLFTPKTGYSLIFSNSTPS
jgi:hypothetical protein